MSDTRDRGRRGPGGDRPRKGPPKGPSKGPFKGPRREAAGDEPRRPGKPGAKSFGAKASAAKSFGAKSFGPKPSGSRSFAGDRPARPFGGKDRPERGDGGFKAPRRSEGGERSEGRREGSAFRRDDSPRAQRPRSEGRSGAGFSERPAFAARRPERKAGPRKPDVSKPLPTSPSAREDGGQRIAKAMARAGLCSRRDAERWIEEGRVAVNGKVLESPGVTVSPSDRITVDGVPLAARERTRLFLFHKPRGTVTTDRDPEGRTTVFDVLPEGLPRVVTVGRLDINTEGLLLLTNDGGLARVLELPSTGWLRRYRVRAHGEIDQPRLDALRGGVEIEGVQYAGIEAVLDRVQGSNVWLTMGLREGKNREVKRVLEHLGLSVNRLIRISFGPFQLADLPEGEVEEVRMRILKDQLGAKLAAEAGVDFTSEIHDREMSDREMSGRPARMPEARGGERPLRGRRQEASEPAERLPAPERPKPGSRKHVSTIRAERGEDKERKRTVILTTEDRRGRTVTVERREKANPAPATKERRSDRSGASERPQRRRDDAAPRERSDRPARGERFGSMPRSFGEGRSRGSRDEGFAPRGRSEAGERSGRGDRSSGPRKSFAGEDRPQRRMRDEGASSPSRRSFGGDDRPQRRPREESGSAPRSRGEGGFKPAGRRPGGPGGPKGPPRKPGGAPKGRGR